MAGLTTALLLMSLAAVRGIDVSSLTELKAALGSLTSVAPTTTYPDVLTAIDLYHSTAAAEWFPDFEDHGLGLGVGCDLQWLGSCALHLRIGLGAGGWAAHGVVQTLPGLEAAAGMAPQGSAADGSLDLTFDKPSATTITITQDIQVSEELFVPNTAAVLKFVGAPHATLTAVGGLHRIFNVAPYAEVEFVNLTLTGGTANACTAEEMQFLDPTYHHPGLTVENPGFDWDDVPAWWGPSLYHGFSNRSGGAVWTGTRFHLTHPLRTAHGGLSAGGLLSTGIASPLHPPLPLQVSSRSFGATAASSTITRRAPRAGRFLAICTRASSSAGPPSTTAPRGG